MEGAAADPRMVTALTWQVRWYVLSVEGELACYRARTDVGAKAPLWKTWTSTAVVAVLPPERLEHLVRVPPRAEQ